MLSPSILYSLEGSHYVQSIVKICFFSPLIICSIICLYHSELMGVYFILLIILLLCFIYFVVQIIPTLVLGVLWVGTSVPLIYWSFCFYSVCCYLFFSTFLLSNTKSEFRLPFCILCPSLGFTCFSRRPKCLSLLLECYFF